MTPDEKCTPPNNRRPFLSIICAVIVPKAIINMKIIFVSIELFLNTVVV
jgi:hypothetical protein